MINNEKIKMSFFILFLLMFLMWNTGYGDSGYVQMVKGGQLQMCPNSTVEEIVNSFMGSPTWGSGESENGTLIERFINRLRY